MLKNKSLIVWILGFCTFTAALTTFHALLLQTQYGSTATFETNFLSPFIGPIQVATVFWSSLILTCALFGATSFAAFRYSLEFDTLIKLSSVLNHNTKQLTTLLCENNKAVEGFRQGLSQSIGTEIENLRLEVKDQIAKQQGIIRTVEKQAKITMDTKRKLKTLEKRLSPKPKIAIDDKPQKIKGIGPRIAKKLKEIGVTNIGELITIDPVTLALGTELTEDRAKVLQSRAKLLMIPGLDEEQIDLLEQLGIT